MPRTGFQDAAYASFLLEKRGQFQQVLAAAANISALMNVLVAAQQRLTASLATPDADFGRADQADIDALGAAMAPWATYQPQIAALLANPPTL